MYKLELPCPTCLDESNLEFLSPNHPEYQMANFINDGTKKWYFCNKCGGVYCKDKMTSAWQYSPKTYDSFVEKGIIEDKLG